MHMHIDKIKDESRAAVCQSSLEYHVALVLSANGKPEVSNYGWRPQKGDQLATGEGAQEIYVYMANFDTI
ncbi:unnamed protein product [Camellia sinensis]